MRINPFFAAVSFVCLVIILFLSLTDSLKSQEFRKYKFDRAENSAKVELPKGRGFIDASLFPDGILK